MLDKKEGYSILPPATIGWEEIPEGELKQKQISHANTIIMGKHPKEIGIEIYNIEKEIRESNFDAKPKNHRLVGHLKKEFEVPKHLRSNNIKNYLIWAAGVSMINDPQYKRYFNRGSTDFSKILDADLFWVNYQKKHEFNPIHNHVGIISWVVWNKIPYDIEEEMKVFPDIGPGNAEIKPSLTSSFNFVFEAGLGNIGQTPILVDKKMENYICMFPSYLNHLVYPFYTSDDYRVSFSGNIFLTAE